MMSSPQASEFQPRALVQRSDTLGLIRFSVHVSVAFGTGWLVLGAAGTTWVLPAVILHGIVLVFLFCAEHESIHFTAFRTRALNWTVAWLVGLVLMLPPLWFRCFHLAHHRWTQDLARDPELVVPKPDTVVSYLWWISGVPYWRGQLTVTLRHVLGRVNDVSVPERSKRCIVRDARLLWAAYAALAAAAIAAPIWRELLLLWIIPVLGGQLFLRLYLLAEHTGCPYVDNALVNSRTARTNALVRALAWNMPYHVEHHACPGVPFHALPRIGRPDEIAGHAHGGLSHVPDDMNDGMGEEVVHERHEHAAVNDPARILVLLLGLK